MRLILDFVEVLAAQLVREKKIKDAFEGFREEMLCRCHLSHGVITVPQYRSTDLDCTVFGGD